MEIDRVRIVPCRNGGNRLETISFCKAGTAVVQEIPFAQANILDIVQNNNNYNQRMAWALVGNILNILKEQPALLKSILEHRPPFARGLADGTWDQGDTVVLNRLVESSEQSRNQIKELYDIVATCNIVTSSGLVGKERVAVAQGFFEHLSFADHACQPNTEIIHNSDGSTTLRALFDIPPNAPVTWRYIDTQYKAEGRVFPGPPDVEALRTHFGFECACATCTGRCVVCDEPTSKRCKDCQFTVLYCGKKCQKVHWPMHRKEHMTH